MSIKLMKPTLDMQQEYMEFAREWETGGEQIIPYSVRLLGNSYAKWLEKTYEFEHSETCPDGFVPASTYFLMRDLKILGAVNIRHRLNDYLFNYGGHIGYGIRPSERRKGYAMRMLSMTLPLAKQLKLTRVLITCDKNNIASAKTIVGNGGVLENEVSEDDCITQRYWIEL